MLTDVLTPVLDVDGAGVVVAATGATAAGCADGTAWSWSRWRARSSTGRLLGLRSP